MPSITRNIKVSKETLELIEELMWVLGRPEDCVMVTAPDGSLTINNERRDHVLEIQVEKGAPPQFSGPNSYQGNG